MTGMLLGMLTGCHDASPPSFPAETIWQMQSIVTEEMTEHNVHGVIAGVWVPGQGEWVYAGGLADTQTATPMAIMDKVRIASITKSFTATVVLQLIDEGLLTLETPLSTFIPDVPQAEHITIRQLLNHTSGLFTYTADATFTSTLLAEPTTEWTPRQLVDLAIAHPANNAPGEGYAYSNTNYILLGMIIEQLTGRTVEEEVQTRIFDRLGMSASSFPRTGDCAMPGAHSHGYWPLQEGGFLDITEIDPSSHWTSGAIISNVIDLRTWVEALATGQLISPAMQQERLTCRDTGDGITRYGLGILQYGEFLGHDGTLPGFDSVMYYLPSRHATFVILANTVGAGHAPKDIFKRIVAILLPDAVAW